MDTFSDLDRDGRSIARALINLVQPDLVVNKKLGLEGGCEKLVACMALYPVDLIVQIYGCRAIGLICHENAHNKTLCGLAGACKIISTALLSFPTIRDLAHHACRSVAVLGKGNQENVTRFREAGVCDGILQVLTSFGQATEVQAYAASAVAVLACEEACRTQLIERGVCEKMVSALYAFTGFEQVKFEVMRAVLELAKGEDGRRRLRHAGIGERVVAALSMPPQPDFIFCTLKAIAELTKGHPENRRALSLVGCCHGVVNVLSLFHGHAPIQAIGMFVVSKLAFSTQATVKREDGPFTGSWHEEESNGQKLLGVAAVKLVLDCLSTFPTEPLVQQMALLAMVNMTCDAENRRFFGEARGCQKVVQALRNSVSNSDILTSYACWAVANLAYKEPENVTKLIAADALDAVLTALTTFKSSPLVQDAGLRALTNLSYCHVDNATAIGTSGGCEAILNGLTSVDSRSVVMYALRAMINIGNGQAENLTKLRQLDARKHVEDAMLTFSEDAEIQSNGHRALETLEPEQAKGGEEAEVEAAGAEEEVEEVKKRDREDEDPREPSGLVKKFKIYKI